MYEFPKTPKNILFHHPTTFRAKNKVTGYPHQSAHKIQYNLPKSPFWAATFINEKKKYLIKNPSNNRKKKRNRQQHA